jgi:hypothetical protein
MNVFRLRLAPVLFLVILSIVVAFAVFVVRWPSSASTWPDFTRQTGNDLADWNFTSIVVCQAPVELKLNHKRIDHDVATSVAYGFNTHRIKVVDPARVSEWLEKQELGKNAIDPSELGAEFHVNFVVYVELSEFEISRTLDDTHFQGSAVAKVHVLKMGGDGQLGKTAYTKVIVHRCPVKTVEESNDLSEAAYTRLFLFALSTSIGRLFYVVEPPQSLLDPVFEDCVNGFDFRDHPAH